MGQDRDIEFRWGRLIRELQREKVSYIKMAEQVGLDRRRFSDLAGATDPGKWEKNEFTIADLAKIESLLLMYGKRPGPMFSRTRLLEAISQRTKITVFLGSTARDNIRTDVGYWDVLSLGELLSLCSESGTRPIAVEAVRSVNAAIRRIRESQPRWYLALKEQGSATVGLGSPRASLASEMLLSHIFGVKPFGGLTQQQRPKLPFQFVWSGGSLQCGQSSFGRVDKNATSNSLETANDTLSAPSERTNEDHDVYGVVVCQATNTSTRVVLAGVSGPGTLASVQCLEHLSGAIPTDGTILWAPVRALVTVRKSGYGDVRRLTDLGLIHELREVKPGGQWKDI